MTRFLAAEESILLLSLISGIDTFGIKTLCAFCNPSRRSSHMILDQW